MSPVNGRELSTKCNIFPVPLLQGSQGDSKNAKKKNNKKTNKNKSSISRANKKKPSMPNVSNDLSQKLYATMEKHKEVLWKSAGKRERFIPANAATVILRTEKSGGINPVVGPGMLLLHNNILEEISLN